MKIPASFSKSWLRWLILPVFLFGGLFIAQTTQAAGPCSLTYVHQGLIEADETWCAGGDNTHYLTGDVTVKAGVTLTIAAGVTVDSSADAWSKYLIVQGHLDINGTLAQPVLLTRSFNYPNQNWSGLYFDGSQGDGSGTINYANIEHAGSNFLPPGCTGVCGKAQTAVFVKDLAAGKQVTISNSTIHDNTSKGLFVVASKVDVSNTAFSHNQYPVWIEGAQSVVTYSGNTFTGNAYPYYDNVNYTVQEDSIILGPDALTGKNFSLPAQTGLDAYVFFSGFSVPAGTAMTAAPGVTLRMSADRYLSVQGRLEAAGAPALPVRFSSIPSSGSNVTLYWGGLYFDGSAGDGSAVIDHALIELGGSNFLPPGCTGSCGTAQTAVFIKDLPAAKQLNLSHTIIQNSLGKGLFVVNSDTAHVDATLIKGGRIGADIASNLTISNLALIDQVLDGVIVENGVHVDARHLTIARAGRSGFHVYSGASGLLQNSILSQNALAVWSEGSAQTSLDTNLADANTSFVTGTVTEKKTFQGAALFEADGYHIQATSAAVGVGLADLSAVDIDGDVRPSPAGTRPDLGADEIEAGFHKLFLPLAKR